MNKLQSILTIFIAISLSSCTQTGTSLNKTGSGAIAGTLLGAGTGAIIGSATGDAGRGTAIGAGLGAASGALFGNQLQKQDSKEQQFQERQRRQEEELERQRREIEELKNQRGSDNSGSNYQYPGSGSYNSQQQKYDDQYRKY